MMRKFYLAFLSVILLVSIMGCARPAGYSGQAKRDFILEMKDNTLNQLYAKRPHARDTVQQAAGYAVFSNVNAQFLFFGGSNGYGVAIDNTTGEKTYMKMAEAGVGLGVGVKDFREVIIFNNRTKFRDFVTRGWEFSAKADAAAKSDQKGAAATGAVSFDRDVIVYQLTEAGVIVGANVSGSKYWRYDELN